MLDEIKKFTSAPRTARKAYFDEGELTYVKASVSIECLMDKVKNEVITLVLEGKLEQAQAYAKAAFIQQVVSDLSSAEMELQPA